MGLMRFTFQSYAYDYPYYSFWIYSYSYNTYYDLYASTLLDVTFIILNIYYYGCPDVNYPFYKYNFTSSQY